MTRKTAIVLTALFVGVCAMGVSVGLSWVERYSDQMSELVDESPEQAQARMVRDARMIAVAAGAVTSALSVFLFWYGIRGLRTQSMPPAGSWIVEGQPIRIGPDAVLRAKLLLVMSAVLCLLGIVAAAMLWRLPEVLLTGGPELRPHLPH